MFISIFHRMDPVDDLKRKQDFCKDLRTFCEVTCLPLKNAEAVIRQRIVMSLEMIDRRYIFEELFPDHTLDWEAVYVHMGNVWRKEDVENWLTLIRYVSFDTPPVQNEELFQYLQRLRSGLKCSFPDIKASPADAVVISAAHCQITLTWDQTCKLLILVNIRTLDKVQVVKAYLDAISIPDSVNQANLFARHLINFKHSQADYDAAFLSLLSTYISVASDEVQDIIRSNSAGDAFLTTYKQHVTRNRRPVLMDLINKNMADLSMEQDDTGRENMDSFLNFCRLSSFPASMHIGVKKFVYFMCAQEGYDTTPYLKKVIDSMLQMVELEDKAIVNVDIEPMLYVIDVVLLEGLPFKELKIFKKDIFAVHINMQNIKNVSWTLVLKFYTSVYQRDEVWKKLWRNLIQRYIQGHADVISNDLIVFVGEFVKKFQFRHDVVVPLIIKNVI